MELSQVVLCNQCGLKNNLPCETIRLNKNDNLIIVEIPLSVQEKDYLIKIIKDAGLDREKFSLACAIKCQKGKFSECRNWLWSEIKTVNPVKIITFGAKVPDWIIGKTKWSFDNPVNVSYGSYTIYPLRSLKWLMNNGKGEFEKHVQFFKKNF